MADKHDASGDCYEANFLKFIEIAKQATQRDKYRLVHAEVAGQGQLEGVRFGHAFILDIMTDEVWDFSNGREIHLDFNDYEKAGQIQAIGNGHQYTFDEAIEKAFETTIYGPWDLETSTGL